MCVSSCIVPGSQHFNGTVLQNPVGAFRVIPYHARKAIPLPKNILDFVDIELETLDEMEKDEDEGYREDFAFKGMPQS